MQALLALFLFQASRFPARGTNDGELILLKDQDRQLWDRRLIAEGFSALRKSQAATMPTRYHLEAAMAGLHAATSSWDETDWRAIIQLYDRLDEVEPSEYIKINQAVAYIELGQLDKASDILGDIDPGSHMAKQPIYHLACARLAEARDKPETLMMHLEAARTSTTLDPLRGHLDIRLAALE